MCVACGSNQGVRCYPVVGTILWLHGSTSDIIFTYTHISCNIPAVNINWDQNRPMKQESSRSAQGRIQEFIWGARTKGPQSKIKGEARIEGAKLPVVHSRAKLPTSRARRAWVIEGEAPEPQAQSTKTQIGGGVLGRGLHDMYAPILLWKNFQKMSWVYNTIQFNCAYLKQLFELTKERC